MINSFEELAEDYDDDIYPLSEPEFVQPIVDALKKLMPGKDVLEFGVGTGRIAIPLARSGLSVTGLDFSPQMLAKLEEKSGGLVEKVVGDMATTKLKKRFDLAYAIMNGLTYLLTLDEQITFFKNAAWHLKENGIFVVETFVPRLDQIVKDNTAPYALDAEYVGFDKYDKVNQLVTSYQFDLTSEKTNTFHTTHRYVWASELVLMGKLAGLTLVHQWGDWDRGPLTNDSDTVIMVWKKGEKS